MGVQWFPQVLFFWEFLGRLMAPGATVDWRENLRENLNDDISAKAIQEYFAPLMEWLQEQNKGREYALPEEMG